MNGMIVPVLLNAIALASQSLASYVNGDMTEEQLMAAWEQVVTLAASAKAAWDEAGKEHPQSEQHPG